MLRIIIIFIVSILFASDVDNISYDYSKHQGHVQINGDLLWNEDWFSKDLFFDGTFSNYPSMYGPQIEQNHIEIQTDSSLIDSIKVSSYFDYVQGDYFLDNLDLGINYHFKNRIINMHAFKRRYAGIYNQYSNNSGIIKPINYTYTGSYSAKRDQDRLTISIGNFNSDYGLFDTTSISFIDSRITSSSIKYELKYDSIEVEISMHNFLQRLDSFHSSSSLDGVKYLTRSKIDGIISLLKNNKYSFGFLFDINKRSLRHEVFKMYNWKTFGVFIKNRFSEYSLGFSPYEDRAEISSSLQSNFRAGPVYSALNVKHNIRPAHIAIVDTLLFEIKDQINLKNELRLTNTRFGFNLSIYKVSRSFNYRGLPNSGSSSWLSFYANYCITEKILFNMSFDMVNTDKYVSDGIGQRLKLKIIGKVNLFANAMTANYIFSLDGYLNRQSGYDLSPVEKFPFEVEAEKGIGNLWIPSLSIVSTVKNVEIRYEMNNVLNIIYDSLGKSQVASEIIFNQFYPRKSRLVSLSVKWNFSD